MQIIFTQYNIKKPKNTITDSKKPKDPVIYNKKVKDLIINKKINIPQKGKKHYNFKNVIKSINTKIPL